MMKEKFLGIDIGGTKCAVIFGQRKGNFFSFVEKTKFYITNVNDTIGHICNETRQMMERDSHQNPFFFCYMRGI